MSTDLGEWIEIFESEYLSDFVSSGGSTVKILVCPEGESTRTIESISACSQSAGLITVNVDAAQTRVQSIDRIFFEIAQQIDWAALADRWLRINFEAARLIIPDAASLADLDAIADASGVDRKSLATTFNRIITNNILHDSKLWGEFRKAIACYCVSRVIPTNVSLENAETILQWLRGEKAGLKELKTLGIYQRIGRQNARPILVSLSRWLNAVGYPGISLILDLTAVFQDRDGCNHYTRGQLLDLYELLRQFIDQTHETSRLVVLAIAGTGIVDDPKRDYRNYDAFRLRVVNDVRDRTRDNPLNVLVQIAASGPVEGRSENGLGNGR